MERNWGLVERELFTRRFGSIGVSEMRKVLFAVYMSGYGSSDIPSDYEIGRSLGLSAIQVRNMRSGVNLLLESDEQTKEKAKAALKFAFENQLLEYQQTKGRIAVEIDDPIARDYLMDALEREGVFRDCDAYNGHIAVPVSQFDKLLLCVLDESAVGAIKDAFIKQNPNFVADTAKEKGGFFAKLEKYLATRKETAAVVEALAGLVSTLISCGYVPT